jgi:MFS family permease
MTTSPAAQPDLLRDNALALVLALVTGLDYFDNAIFAFFASYIAGGINASPDELVWASSCYAVAAVLGIVQQQWWIDRLGHRYYIAGCMLLYGGGALSCAICETSVHLALARAMQGYCIGPMMGACRILIQDSFRTERRATAIRLFLICIVFGSALAPLAGGFLVSHLDWRALFACTAPFAFGFAAFALFSVPGSGRLPREARGSAHFGPYMAFAFAQAALQIVMQRVRFELFTASPLLVVLCIAGLAALAWFAYHQWNHPSPLVRLNALRERTFQVGLVLYMFYYYESTGLSYLVSRFLEGGLGYPVENAGRMVGLASLASSSALFLYFRYAKLLPRKKGLVVCGFGIAALVSWMMTRMSPDTSQEALRLPLLLRGLLLLFIVLPVANLTFRIFEIEEFAHGYRLKNIVRQLTISFATASVIIVEQHRQALHESRLSEWVNPYNPNFQTAMQTLANGILSGGRSLSEAHALALVTVQRMVTQQASFLAALDGFSFMMAVALCASVFAIWQKHID